MDHVKYRGRFAPSPTGPLHFGSLVAAVASYLEARKLKGEWLLRIDDLDTHRVVQGAEASIINTLDAYGFEWDGEISHQSQRLRSYADAFDLLTAKNHLFYCECSRKFLKRTAPHGHYGILYPGHCRARNLHPTDRALSVRVKVGTQVVSFNDQVFGLQQQNISTEIGDFIVRRTDGIFAYQLAVVVDDETEQISDVVRGNDLLDSTSRQIYLQQLLDYKTPRYMHLPLAVDLQNNKLGKQTGAQAIPARGCLKTLKKALCFLGQTVADDFVEGDFFSAWNWAIQHWDRACIPRQSFIQFAG